MNVEKIIIMLIKEELKRANMFFSPFNSRHESFAVLKEEFEELIEQIENIHTGVYDDYWCLCRKLKTRKQVSDGNSLYSYYGDKSTNDLLIKLNKTIKETIKEAIQLGAMIQKAIDLENRKGDI